MTNKEAEAYFRQLARGDKANNELDFEAFKKAAGMISIEAIAKTRISMPDLVFKVSNPFEK